MMRAIIAVAPSVAAEFVDENAMSEMPLGLQKIIDNQINSHAHSNAYNNLRGLAVGQDIWPMYLVRGHIDDFIAANDRWGANLVTMISCEKNGLRVGLKKQKQNNGTPEAPDFVDVIVGSPVREIHAELLSRLDDIVTYDYYGAEISRMVPADLRHLPVVLGEEPMEL